MTEAGGLLDSEEVDFLLASGSGSTDKDEGQDSASNQEVTMRGDLEQINLADIFQTLALSKMEGMLRVRNPLEQTEIFFREGKSRALTATRVVDSEYPTTLNFKSDKTFSNNGNEAGKTIFLLLKRTKLT